ncbi:putative Per1-like membrane protein [Ordospora colligata]|uniref:Post-GPI attachment to proteins factor 3 n=1 Tax=Ordospora colligata OC4 TaxID=1354746 RepID=A0A0B2ULW4_9MICR|nr:putative Per1-like membrane protein [Ordospora colligata OC4]KHN70313.1 putative Per1-like membrane protein [Ordospora colligata OC4]TBU16857.1 putative Per1-like membrane protein [Ordospora colligata]TBU16965.1 putative Per1-like membrane protein [Ordospora colligata]TBU19406.1 putative Per1-like membrane protein [Ordospora colligata]
MKSCFSRCIEESKTLIKIQSIDRIFRRTSDHKLGSICHLTCLKATGSGNIKRNGRWGFQPVLGMTEFFSVLFSFANLVTNIVCFNKVLKKHLRMSRFGRLYYIQYYICNLAFISSTLFHIHENTLTRNCDYFFAFLTILFGFYMALVRAISIASPAFEISTRRPLQIAFTSFYSYHVYRMSNIEFDYVYNKISCIIIIGLTLASHMAIFTKYRKHAHAKHILLFTFFFFLAGAIEIQDIPPYAYLIDSHAIWHLVSCVSTPFYVLFWSGDVYMH